MLRPYLPHGEITYQVAMDSPPWSPGRRKGRVTPYGRMNREKLDWSRFRARGACHADTLLQLPAQTQNNNSGRISMKDRGGATFVPGATAGHGTLKKGQVSMVYPEPTTVMREGLVRGYLSEQLHAQGQARDHVDSRADRVRRGLE